MGKNHAAAFTTGELAGLPDNQLDRLQSVELIVR